MVFAIIAEVWENQKKATLVFINGEVAASPFNYL
jgi:hypothetical protein